MPRTSSARNSHGAAIPLRRSKHTLDHLIRRIAEACPLTPKTEGLFRETLLAALPSSAWLINVARGRVVDEAALIEALRQGRLAGAGLDCFHKKPLFPGSPLCSLPSVLITPHSAGETRRYEANVIDILIESLRRLDQGASLLRNEFA